MAADQPRGGDNPEIGDLDIGQVQKLVSATLDRLADDDHETRKTAVRTLREIVTEHPWAIEFLQDRSKRHAEPVPAIVTELLEGRPSADSLHDGRGTDRDWHRTDPRTGDVEPQTPLIPEDQIVVDGQFSLQQADLSVDVTSVIDQIRTEAYARTYSGLGVVNAERQAILIRTYVPPDTVDSGAFQTACGEAFGQWARVDAHPNVLTVHDYGTSPHPWAILGYGSETLRAVNRVTPPAALRVGYRLATAIGYAHECGQLHLRLDPSQIVIDRRPPEPMPRILGFGMTALTRQVTGQPTVDPRFAAPEYFTQSAGARDWTTDIYHLGGIMYQLLTGQPPTQPDQLTATDHTTTVTPPSTIVEGLPSAVDEIVQKAMAPEKLLRYESADEFARDIKATVRAAGG